MRSECQHYSYIINHLLNDKQFLHGTTFVSLLSCHHYINAITIKTGIENMIGIQHYQDVCAQPL